MTYRVIKYVKGIAYAYEQRCYRIGGKVKTESAYIGPVQPISGPENGSDVTSPGPTFELPVGHTDTTGPHVDAAQSDVHAQPKRKLLCSNRPAPTPLSLHIKVDLPSLKISTNALEAEHQLHTVKMAQAGFDPRALPAIIIEYGNAVTHKKKPFRDAYSVTLPKGKFGNRQKLRIEYRKALGRATLDLLERTSPKIFSDLAYAFDASYRATQDALNRYLLHTVDPHKWLKAFALKAFGYMNPVGHVPPEKLGLIDYGERRDWQGEFADLFAAVQSQGFDAVQAACEHELDLACRAETVAIKNPSFRIFERRRAIQRAQARIVTNEQLLRKLILLRWVLSP